MDWVFLRILQKRISCTGEQLNKVMPKPRTISESCMPMETVCHRTMLEVISGGQLQQHKAKKTQNAIED